MSNELQSDPNRSVQLDGVSVRKIFATAIAFFCVGAGLILTSFVLASCFSYPLDGGKMNWLEFLSELIKSLAWPVVVLVLAFQFRERFRDLLARITEATLPGGISIKADLITIEKVVKDSAIEGDAEEEGSPLAPTIDPVATQSNPTGVIMEAWLSAQTALGIFLRATDKDPSLKNMARRNDAALLSELANQSVITTDELFVLQTLRKIRNDAAHNATVRPTPEEAERFVAAINSVIATIASRLTKQGWAPT